MTSPLKVHMYMYCVFIDSFLLCHMMSHDCCYRYTMRYIAMCLRQALHKKFPESDEDDVLKVSTRTTCTYMLHYMYMYLLASFSFHLFLNFLFLIFLLYMYMCMFF